MVAMENGANTSKTGEDEPKYEKPNLKFLYNQPCEALKLYFQSEILYETLGCLALGLLIAHVPKLAMEVSKRPIPHQETAAGDFMVDLTKSEEIVTETVSRTLLRIVALIIPLFLQLVLSLAFGESNDAHWTVCVYGLAFGITVFLTEFIKRYAGYLRPNFYALCDLDEELRCQGEHADNARMSFPSGHASTSFCGTTILTLYLLRLFGVAGKAYANKNLYQTKTPCIRKRIASICFLFPMLVSIFVSASRVADNYHFPADVVTGALVGFATAKAIFNIWFFELRPHL